MLQRLVQPSSSGSSRSLLDLSDPEDEGPAILQEHSATYLNSRTINNTTTRTSSLTTFLTLPIQTHNSPDVAVTLTCFQRSAVDKPINTHRWISDWLYPGLKVNPPTFNLRHIAQRDDELWRGVDTVLLWLRCVWLGSLHMTQVNHFGPRSQSAKQIILMTLSQTYTTSIVVPVHATEAYSGRRGASLFILTLNIRYKSAANFTPWPHYTQT
jgi:hypothetical protein